MKNKKILKSLLFLGIGLLVSVSFVALQKVKAVIVKGLEDGKSIRVSSDNSSCEIQKDSHFSGCNTVI
ncbi:MAG: hypothetical protein Q8N22_03305 [bacterium]|nr:hypothetical protein [bacterium]